ncbi:MAG: outer membrane protein assembly factor BamD [Thioalkalivibrionaceae bacterium]
MPQITVKSDPTTRVSRVVHSVRSTRSAVARARHGVVSTLLISVLTASILAGCASTPDDPTRNWSASQLYGEAQAALNRGDYETAVDYYERLEARFPFGRFAQQAQIEIPYAYYRADEPEAALAAADRFIELNPRHPNLDYAYYLRGLINFNRGSGFLSRLLPPDPERRDPSKLEEAFRDFARVVEQFPDSQYADDSRERLVFIRNTLAGYEYNVALFYFERRAYVASAERARGIVERYQGAEVIPWALALLERSYRELELDDLADNTLAVLDLNYPELAEQSRSGQLALRPRNESGGMMRVIERLPFFGSR